MQCIKPLLTVMKVCCHTSFNFCKEMNEKNGQNYVLKLKILEKHILVSKTMNTRNLFQ